MTDVREDILARLFVIVGTIPNIRASYRNNVDIPPDHLPAAVVLDGDEETGEVSDLSMHPSNKPIAVQMVPEIIIAQQADNVGTDITTLRRELIKRVLFDTELNEQIVKTGRHGNGAIRYLGCQTDLGWMRSLHGALLARFMFKYFLKPNDL
jgi:hypothetical protein